MSQGRRSSGARGLGGSGRSSSRCWRIRYATP
jgi:hypothetical protein